MRLKKGEMIANERLSIRQVPVSEKILGNKR